MAKKKRKLRLSAAERARRKAQALKNFGKRKIFKVRKHRISMARHKKSYRRTTRGLRLGAAAPAVYGYAYENFVRSPVDNLVRTFTANQAINISDNLARIAGLYLIRMFIKVPVVREVTDAGISIEAAQFKFGVKSNGSVTTTTNGATFS